MSLALRSREGTWGWDGRSAHGGPGLPQRSVLSVARSQRDPWVFVSFLVNSDKRLQTQNCRRAWQGT